MNFSMQTNPKEILVKVGKGKVWTKEEGSEQVRRSEDNTCKKILYDADGNNSAIKGS